MIADDFFKGDGTPMEGERAYAPHCDNRVLHEPGECKYCDKYPDWQEARTRMGIAFTGKVPTEHQSPCPSDFHRGTGGAHVWGGNVPRPPDDAT